MCNMSILLLGGEVICYNFYVTISGVLCLHWLWVCNTMILYFLASNSLLLSYYNISQVFFVFLQLYILWFTTCGICERTDLSFISCIACTENGLRIVDCRCMPLYIVTVNADLYCTTSCAILCVWYSVVCFHCSRLAIVYLYVCLCIDGIFTDRV